MALWRLKLQEVVRALCVVALIFLSFGHAPSGIGGEFTAAPLSGSFCGNPINGPDEAEGNPCQACRIGAGAALPPPPCAETASFPSFAAVAYPEVVAPIEHPRRYGSAGPRAPPTV